MIDRFHMYRKVYVCRHVHLYVLVNSVNKHSLTKLTTIRLNKTAKYSQTYFADFLLLRCQDKIPKIEITMLFN